MPQREDHNFPFYDRPRSDAVLGSSHEELGVGGQVFGPDNLVNMLKTGDIPALCPYSSESRQVQGQAFQHHPAQGALPRTPIPMTHARLTNASSRTGPIASRLPQPLMHTVRPLAWYTAMTYTEPCGHVRRNPALHETGRRLPKRRSLRRTPKPSGEPSTRWSGDSRLTRGQKAQVGTTWAREAGWNSRDLLPAAGAGSDMDADPVS